MAHHLDRNRVVIAVYLAEFAALSVAHGPRNHVQRHTLINGIAPRLPRMCRRSASPAAVGKVSGIAERRCMQTGIGRVETRWPG